MDEPKTILLVDDDEGFVDTIAVFLRRKGFAVEVEKTVDAALKRLESLKPDFAIVDLLLDDGDGTDVVRRIKEKYPKTYTIVLSGHREDQVKDKVAGSGADEFLPKPLTASQLKAILEKAFS